MMIAKIVNERRERVCYACGAEWTADQHIALCEDETPIAAICPECYAVVLNGGDLAEIARKRAKAHTTHAANAMAAAEVLEAEVFWRDVAAMDEFGVEWLKDGWPGQ